MKRRLHVLFLLVCLLAVSARAADPPAPAAGAFPTFGVSMTPPPGWVRGPEEPSRGLIAQWGAPAGPDGKIQAAIIVDVTRASNQTLVEYAKARAAAIGATVAPDATSLGDSPALRIVGPPRPDRPRPLEMIVALHRGYFYGVTLLGGQQQLDPTLLAFSHSWKWIPFESPDAHLEMRAGPVPILRGAIAMDIPMVMRPLPVRDGAAELQLGAYNFSRGDLDLSVDAQLMAAAPGKTVNDLVGAFTEALSARVKFDQPLAWKSDDHGRFTSQLVVAAIPTPDHPDHKAHVQWALIDVGEGQVVLVSVTLTMDADAGEVDNYEAAAMKMISSLHRRPAQPGK